MTMMAPWRMRDSSVTAVAISSSAATCSVPVSQAADAGAAGPLQGSPDLRLEDDDDTQDKAGQGVAHEEVDDAELQDAAEQEEHADEGNAAAQQGHRRGAAQSHEQGVDDGGDDQNVERRRPRPGARRESRTSLISWFMLARNR